ncbi:SDR family NAD(P)-dependent oxidoreductase, partial [Kitasatospora sp. NPDC018058]|uniref:SDR family NAD(P)-dependent oxidoreductase n=1 Tax=Kitasatospora sp. NPDC018058 TaxID=3364025 RepID=UPI0037C08546
ELTAAHVAGVLNLTDAAQLVAARARLMQSAPAGGTMIAIQATEHELREHLTETVSIAALNSPDSTVVSGDTEAAERIAAHFKTLGRKTRTLTVSHAFHSPHMDPILDAFRTEAAQLTYHQPTIPVVSNLTGQLADQLTSPDYWTDHIRQAVRFTDTIHTLHTNGVTTYLELGPDPVLTALTHTTLDGKNPHAISALRKDHPETRTVATTLATLHTHGHPTTRPTPPTTHLDLPTYPFQRDHYWLTPTQEHPAPTNDTTDSRFWEAVHDQDLGALSDLLDLPDGSAHAGLGEALPALAQWRTRQRTRSRIDSWRHRITWQPLPEARTTGILSGTWLAVIPEGRAADATVSAALRALARAGAETVVLELANTDLDRAVVAARLTEALDGVPVVSGAVSLLATAGAPGVLLSLVLIQALGDAGVRAPLWLLTQGAVAVTPTDPLTTPAQAQVWGLGQTTGLEHPDRWGGLIDLPPVLDERTRAQLSAALGGIGHEDQLAVRPAATYVRRLTPAPLTADATTGDPATWRGTVLITGGTGSLGAHTARHLVHHGARHLVLTSRRGPDTPGATELRDELQAHGAHITITACDTTDRTALRTLLDHLTTTGHPVRAVFHAAGTGQTTPLTEMDPEEFNRVTAGKVTGAALLDELLAGQDLDAFVLFSSVSATWGSGRTGAYAAGNAYLDALAVHRRQRGERATSIAWGAWAESAMVDAHTEEQLRRRGALTMAPDLAVQALDQALAHDDTNIAVAHMDWPRFIAAYTAARPRPLIDDLPDSRPVPSPPVGVRAAAPRPAEPASALRGRLAALSPAERHTSLVGLVRTAVAEVLGHRSEDAVAADQAFLDLGLDSLTAVEVRNRLNLATGLRLPAMLLFDCPTPTEVADRLVTGLVEGGGEQPSDAEEPGADESNERLAVVYRKVSLLGRMREVEGLLSGAACLRETVDDPAELARGRRLVRLAQGPEQPELICFPPFAPVEQSLQFARLSTRFRGLRNVSLAPVPGFQADEPLAASVEVLVEALAEVVLRGADGAPFALLGYSSSGWVAHAVAMHLESRGHRPSGVLLLDTYLPDTMSLDLRKAMTYEVNERRKRFTTMNFASLTALGSYRGMFRAWTPEPVSAPTLFLRPAECIPGSPEEPMTGDGWRAVWPFEHTDVEVPGDHCTMIADHADATADAVHRWLAEQI